MIDLNTSPDKLRKSILQEAMQGKLTQQLLEDGDATDLLRSITEEKQHLYKAGKIKKPKQLAAITDDEIPFKIPDNWQWVRLQTILKLEKGSIRRGPFGSSITKSMFVPKSNDTYKVYEQGNAIHESSEYGNYYITKDKYDKLHSFHVKPGDIIISGAGTIGKTYILPNDCPEGVINQALIRIRLNTNVINKNFFLLLFKAKLGIIQSKSIGSAIKNMASIKALKKQLIWQLPPLAEQQRIVTKLDSLLPKVDSFKQSVDHIQTLRSELPPRLRRSFLQEAMQGKLTQQLPEDGDAADLLQSMVEEKQRLYKAGKIKKPKQLSAIIDDEIPFEIPDNWKWVRLNEIMDVRDGTHNTPKYVDEGIPLITSKNIKDGAISFQNVKYISKIDSDKINKRSKVNINDILMPMIGTIGNPAINRSDRNFSIKNVALIKYNKFICTKFIYLYILFIQKKLKSNSSGAVQSFISLTKIRNMLIALPPLSEQERIADKLDYLSSKLNKI